MSDKFDGIYLNATFVSLDGLRDVVEMKLDKGTEVPTELKRLCGQRFTEPMLPHVPVNVDTRKYRTKAAPKPDDQYPEFLVHGIYYEVLGGGQ